METNFITMLSIVYNLLIKLLFLVCIILQVVLWPNVFTLTFTGAVALEGIITLLSMNASDRYEAFVGKGVLFFHGGSRSVTKYVLTIFITIYMFYFLVTYVSFQYTIMPRMTTWIHNDYLRSYSFVNSENKLQNAPKVDHAISKKMRDNTFVWPRVYDNDAILLNGTLVEAMPTKLPEDKLDIRHLKCPLRAQESNFSCFALNLAPFPVAVNDLGYPQNPNYPNFRVVPMPSEFYTIDVKLTPLSGSNILCKKIEAYRIVVNDESEALYGLDYPASGPSFPVQPSGGRCGLFGYQDWCLRYGHSFTPEAYDQEIGKKCNTFGNSLVFRLPARTKDIDPETGKTVLDAILVTKNVHVQVKYTWHYERESVPPVLRNLEDWAHSTEQDMAQDWRISSEATAVFFKFFITIIPLLVCWYVLASEFPKVVSDTNQVMFLCIFILLPSVLIFLTVGAYLPMAGNILCAIAINHSPPVYKESSTWLVRYFRPIVFFISAACNCIQFIWILFLTGIAGWPAFYFPESIQQLSDMSSNFIISAYATPFWVALIMPIVLTINITMVLGWAIGFVLEMLPVWASSY